MIQAMYNQSLDVVERPPSHPAARSDTFRAWFSTATATDTLGTAPPAASANSASAPESTVSAAGTSLGDPDVQGWLNTYYTEQGDLSAANTSYQPATGAGNNFAVGGVWGPDAIFAQALANQAGNAFASMTGDNPAEFTSQLPGIPTQQAQQQFDQMLAIENAERLASGQPIDTTAYWSDPGPITLDGVTYTSQQLGYAGPGQSSGPEPIYVSQANQVGTDTYSVPGYNGTVTNIQPGRYYTLQQLEQAGLTAGQPDAQFHPGSWTLTQNA